MSKIIKISNKKSVSKTENQQIERLKKQLLELEEETQTTQNRATDYAQNKSKIDSAYSTANANSNAISGLTTRVGTAEQNISSLSNDLDSHVQNYNSLNQRFSNLVQAVGVQGQHITATEADVIALQNTKQNKLTAGTGINIDQNNVISATGGSGGGTDYSSTIATLQGKIAALETYVDDFDRMIHDRNAIYNTPYEAIDQDDVVQTYDFAEMPYDYSGTAPFRTCMFNFYVHPNTTTLSLKITLKISGSAAGTGTLKLYFNSFSNTHLQTFDYSTTDQLVEIYFTPSVSTAGNHFFAYIHPQSGQTIHISHFKAEIYNCTNPIFFTKVKQYYIDYYGGYYYIHDCRGATAKRAIVNVNDLTALDNITWTDTGIPALAMITLAKVNTSTSPYSLGTISYAYIDKAGHTHFINNYTGQNREYTLSTAMLSTGNQNSYAGLCYHDALSDSTKTQRRTMLSTTATTTVNNITTDTSIAYMQGVQAPFDYLMNESSYIYVQQNADGTCKFRFGSSYFDLGFGRVVACYFRDNSYYKFNIYMNVYGKIILHKLDYDYIYNIYTLQSSTEVGYYDTYLEGRDGDYFVIKDKKLYYYKNQNNI
ncbi:MAG: hypothetical protein IKR12_00530 [Clostridia bacterium]|nr:hypothetical protein [Clostridia bacterium]